MKIESGVFLNSQSNIGLVLLEYGIIQEGGFYQLCYSFLDNREDDQDSRFHALIDEVEKLEEIGLPGALILLRDLNTNPSYELWVPTEDSPFSVSNSPL